MISLVLLAGCALDTPDLATTDQDLTNVAAQVELGDFDSDGVANTGRDAVSYINSLGIELFTYGIVDDTYNKAIGIGRRFSDYQVRSFSDACLDQYGIARRPYPPELVPGIVEMAKNYARIPQDVLRQMGKDGWQLHVFGELGALAHRFDGTANNWRVEAIFGYSTATTYWGRARWAPPGTTSDEDFGPWEPLRNVQRSGAFVTFDRDEANQRYVLAFDPGYQNLNGSFSDDGVNYSVMLRSRPVSAQLGATTAAGGFQPDNTTSPPHTCEVSSDKSSGNTGPAIAFKVGSVGDALTGTHELGHVIESMVHAKKLHWNQADSDQLNTLFGDTNECVRDKRCIPSLSYGYVSTYAASNQAEDFADTFETFVHGYNYDYTLEQAIDWNEARINAKLAFISQRIGLPETGPAVARHSSSNVLYRFVNDGPMHVSTTEWSANLSATDDSRVSLAAASNDSSMVWFASNSRNGLVSVRSINASGVFGSWKSTGHYNRLPVALAPVDSSTMALLMTGDDHNIYYRLFDSTTGALGAVGSLPGVRSVHQLAAASLDGYLYVFAIEETSGNIAYTRLDRSMTVQSWTWPGLSARSIAAARTRKSDGTYDITLVAVDKRFRIQSKQISATFAPWVADPNTAKVSPNIAVSDTRDVYVRGFDGAYRVKRLGTTNAFQAVNL